jgi:Tfp pilus assembly protein PilZ
MRVNYGERDFSRSGFTGDLSEGGVFIVTNTLEPLGTRLHVQLLIDANRTAYFEGVVTWRSEVPPELRSLVKRGFGVRFLPAHEVLEDLVSRNDGPLVARYETREALKQAYANELRLGAVFIPTQRALGRDAEVGVTVELGFVGRTFEFEATVLHLSEPAPPGVRGAALQFRNPAAVNDVLMPLMAEAKA